MEFWKKKETQEAEGAAGAGLVLVILVLGILAVVVWFSENVRSVGPGDSTVAAPGQPLTPGQAERRWQEILKANPAASRESSGSAAASGRRISGSNFFGCRDRAKFDELNGYLHTQDRAAFIGSVGRAYRAGDCRPFTAGETVFVSDTALFSGMIRVRPQGENESWWAYAEAVR